MKWSIFQGRPLSQETQAGLCLSLLFFLREFLLILLVLSRFECKICEWKLLFFLCFSAGVLLESSLYSVKEGWLLYCYACACVFQMHDVHVPQARRSLTRKWRRFAPIYARPRNNWRHLYPFTSGLSVCVYVCVCPFELGFTLRSSNLKQWKKAFLSQGYELRSCVKVWSGYPGAPRP